MSDTEETVEEKIYIVEKATNGRAACKVCKQKCPASELRIAKLAYNPFAGGKMKQWHHIDCIFEAFLKQRPTTKRFESSDEIDGFDDLSDEDREMLEEKISESERNIARKYNLKGSPKKKPEAKPMKKRDEKPQTSKADEQVPETKSKDGLFREFRRLVANITNVSSYTEKTSIVSKMFTSGSDGTKFQGDIKLWCRLLIPGVVKRVYNLQSKQLVKLFSKIFATDQDDMLEQLEKGDVSETIQDFFEKSKVCKPSSKSLLTIVEVDEFLEELTKLTKEDDQIKHFKKFVPRCTGNDLKFVIRLIKNDLKMNAGAKHILEGVHPDAYEVFQTSRDINAVLDRCLSKSNTGSKHSVKAKVSLMTPVLPMLAEACRSVEQAMKKCPNGMYSEIKYDGERVQVHKQGSEFHYYSRSLKPVMEHKIKHFKKYIPEAFPHGKDLILDSEILMVDIHTGKPLPFGTLGKHKKDEFKDATVCLFVFDCIYYNGEDLTSTPLKKRKALLKSAMTEIPNHIVFAEVEEIHKKDDLKAMIAKVLKMGLEGLVLKDLKSVYEPGKRHWLKVKKDYLFGGAMADTADLIVLGAWYGTGKKGGMMSVFLMGCYDEKKKRFCTVTKVHTGHDDKTLERLQVELEMEKISGDSSKVPDWLHCTKTMIPDFVARDPEKQPVWEITGAEFTQQDDVHTADGISIRFPRVTRIRDDKNWQTATTLAELNKLFKESKENTDVSLLTKDSSQGSSKDNKDESAKANKQKKTGDLTDFVKKTDRKADRSPDNSNQKKKKRKSNVLDDTDSSGSDSNKKESQKKKKIKDAGRSPNNSNQKKNKQKSNTLDDTDSSDSDRNKKESQKKKNDKDADRSPDNSNQEKKKQKSNTLDDTDSSDSDSNKKENQKRKKDNDADRSPDNSNRKKKKGRSNTWDDTDSSDSDSNKKESPKKKKDDADCSPDNSNQKKKGQKSNTLDDTYSSDSDSNKKVCEKKKKEKDADRSPHNSNQKKKKQISNTLDDTDSSDSDSNKKERQKKKKDKKADRSPDNTNQKKKKRRSNTLDDTDSSDSDSNKKERQQKSKNMDDGDRKRRKRSSSSSSKTSKDSSPEPSRVKIDNPLPSFFENVYLLIDQDSTSDLKEPLRHFVAYSGNVVSKDEREKATHILHANGEDKDGKYEDLKEVVHVTVDWIKDSIGKKCLQDDKRYRVYLAQ